MKEKLYLLLLLAVMLAGCSVKPETLGDLASAYATVDDSIRVHYKQYGDGDKTICFVHGFGCDLNTWEKQFEGLRDEQNLRLVFIDLPGYGESSKPHVEYTLDFYAKAVNAVLDKEHVGAITLVGHSLGTPVCRQVLMRGRQGSLVDIDGVYCFYDGTETPEYVEAVTQGELNEKDTGAVFDKGNFGGSGGKDEDLYAQAVDIVRNDKKASISYIQRRLRIGYNRAASLIDKMEEEGIVSGPDAMGKRQIIG
jgi:pimeloyl-ACP methyl ester carboxylesterase